ncbi:MAG: hypothetical protein LBF70_00990 [Holosporales bacterium]|jgi:ribosome-binding protein aMBF1 (putative translation factor)|nr:hypothetical protein [Holosporales bacterium]
MARSQFIRGKFTSTKELAAKKNINESYVRRILNMNYLPPEVKVEILEGILQREVRLVDLMENISVLWNEQ